MKAKSILVMIIFSALAGVAMADHHLASQVYVVHGIPGPRELQEGDIISIDVGAILDGYHGDAAVTLPVGEIAPGAKRLLEVTEAALYECIAAAKEGNRAGDISAIAEHVDDATEEHDIAARELANFKTEIAA